MPFFFKCTNSMLANSDSVVPLHHQNGLSTPSAWAKLLHALKGAMFQKRPQYSIYVLCSLSTTSLPPVPTSTDTSFTHHRGQVTHFGTLPLHLPLLSTTVNPIVFTPMQLPPHSTRFLSTPRFQPYHWFRLRSLSWIAAFGSQPSRYRMAWRKPLPEPLRHSDGPLVTCLATSFSPSHRMATLLSTGMAPSFGTSNQSRHRLVHG